MGLLSTHAMSHYMYIVIEHGVLTFKLSKIGDVHYVYRPANQDQEQTSVVQRGFKGSQRPSATTWMVVGLKWQQRVLGWVGEPAGLGGTSWNYTLAN
jgi:hypothetical protein